jgi:hypothetical protein
METLKNDLIKWKEDCSFISSSSQIIEHPLYKILDREARMTYAAYKNIRTFYTSLIFEDYFKTLINELNNDPFIGYFFLLVELIGFNPVPPSHAGCIDKMVDDFNMFYKYWSIS